MIEPGGAGRRSGPAGALERVQPDVVVIATSGQEGQLIADTTGDLEAEDVAVEADGAVELSHLQVDMADLRAGIDRCHAASLPRPAHTHIGDTPNPTPQT